MVPLAAPYSFAQRSRTGIQRETSAADAATAIRDVSDKAQDFWNLAHQQRDTTSANLHMNLGAFAGQALALNDIAYNNEQRGYRNDNDLRNGAQRLINLAMEIDRELTRGNLIDSWRMVQQNLLRLSDAYNLGYNAPGLGRRQWRTYGQGQQGGGMQQGGSLRWRGRVDGSDHIILRGSQVSIKHLQYGQIRDSSYDLSQPLPSRNLDLRLNKLRGRGRVEIVNQPAAWNNYTATILVDDPDAGDDYYEFELTW
jgi:hypothetical protein